MRTIQMTLDDKLVADVDRAVKKLSTNRSAFTRDALRAFLDQLNKTELEKNHQQGYKRHPVNQSDFNDWHDEQVWGIVMQRGEIRWVTIRDRPRF